MANSSSSAAPGLAVLFLLVHFELYFIILFMTEIQGNILYDVLLFPVDMALYLGAFVLGVFGFLKHSRKGAFFPGGAIGLVVLFTCIGWITFLIYI